MVDDPLDRIRKLWPQKTALEAMQEAINGDRAYRSEVERIRDEAFRSLLPKPRGELERMAAIVGSVTVGDRLAEMLKREPLGGLGTIQLMTPHIGDIAAQFKLGSAFAEADVVGRTVGAYWLAEMKTMLGPERRQSAAEAALEALRPAVQQERFQFYVQDLLRSLQGHGPELEEVKTTGEKLASEALTEPTPEGALRRFVQSLRGLDPVKQYFLVIIFGPLLVATVAAFITPVAAYVVNKWLQDSPQGQQKQANQRVVREAGGTLILESHRLVVRHKLAVRGVPAAASKVVATIEYGTAVLLVKEQGAFSLVEWSTQDAVVSGWVFSRYLQKFR